MQMNKNTAVGVVGATGYTGQEVMTLLEGHPGARLEFATSRSQAGEPTGIEGLVYSDPDMDRARDCDVVFLCLPHGKAVPWVESLLGRGGEAPRIIDLTADHRPGSGRESAAVYGLNEWYRDSVADAPLVANPGCYPTGMLLSLMPLFREGLVDPARLTVVNAASGVTGAGRAPRPDLLFAEVAGNFRAYGGGNRHRHLREVRSELGEVEILFQPHLLPVSRGILETIVLPVPEGIDADRIRGLWATRYRDEPAITVRESGLPELRDAVGTDRISLGVEDAADTRGPVCVLGVAFDNLGKGAAGQAVQNFNAIMKWPTELGIRC